MKNGSLYLGGLIGFLLSGLLFIFLGSEKCACEETSPAGANNPLGQKGVFVPESTALKDIRRYANHCDSLYNDFPLRGFTMRTSDLYMILDSIVNPLDSNIQVRGYIAMQKPTKAEPEPYRLYLVGAQSLVGSDGLWDTLVPYQNTIGALDLNAPCPNTCDYKSPLYKAGQISPK